MGEPDDEPRRLTRAASEEWPSLPPPRLPLRVSAAAAAVAERSPDGGVAFADVVPTLSP